MSTNHFSLYIERVDPSRNMARFYALSIEPGLFGVTVSRRWGRIGSRGQQRIEALSSEREAIATFLSLAAAKRRKGYRVRGS